MLDATDNVIDFCAAARDRGRDWAAVERADELGSYGKRLESYRARAMSLAFDNADGAPFGWDRADILIDGALAILALDGLTRLMANDPVADMRSRVESAVQRRLEVERGRYCQR